MAKTIITILATIYFGFSGLVIFGLLGYAADSGRTFDILLFAEIILAGLLWPLWFLFWI